MAKKSYSSPDFSGAVDIRFSFQLLIGLVVAALAAGAIYLTAESGYLVPEVELKLERNGNGSSSSSEMNSGCDLFSGRWVFDNESYPLYKEEECTYMSDELACEKFGRTDLGYRHWRWQPHHCHLPRFNGTALLERLRNKRLIFVGDSLNRGQWISMVCLLDKVIPEPGRKRMHNNGSALIYFEAKDYNARIEFYWSPLLVESNSDDPTHHHIPDRIVRAHAIEKHGRHWIGADILVFNTYLWWRKPQMKVLWGSFNSSDGIYKKIDKLRSLEIALQTWSDWLEIHVNRSKTQVFFMSMSPAHERAEEWGKSLGENCYSEMEMISEQGYTGRETDPKMMRIVETTLDEIKRRGLNVEMINITQLTDYRKDGHPSIYRKQWAPPTKEQIANPPSYADCIHWCLPGVPDVWNELLYAYIFNFSSN